MFETAHTKYQHFKNTRNLGKISICVDLDKTITTKSCGETLHWKELPPPNPKIVSIIKSLKKQGYHIIIHTARISEIWRNNIELEKKKVQAYLNFYNIPFNTIWDQIGKPYCTICVDDNCINPMKLEG